MLLMYAIIVHNEYAVLPNSENCLDLIFVAPPCEKFVLVSDKNYITSAVRKFMLDMPDPSSSQNIGL